MDGEQAAVDEPANRGTEPTQSLCGLLDVKAGVRCRAGERHTQSGRHQARGCKAEGLSWGSGHRDGLLSPLRAGMGHSGQDACGSETPLKVDPEALDRQPRKGSRGRF